MDLYGFSVFFLRASRSLSSFFADFTSTVVGEEDLVDDELSDGAGLEGADLERENGKERVLLKSEGIVRDGSLGADWCCF